MSSIATARKIEQKPTVTVKVKDLRVDWGVRTELNHKLVNTFATMYTKGMRLPPLQITSDKRVIDGRTRREALLKAGIIDCQCEIVEGTEAELIALAVAANSGAAPLREEDIRWSLQLLVGKGLSESQIVDTMARTAKWTPDFTRWHLVYVRKEIRNAKLRDAERAVKAGVHVPEASARFGVTEVSLKQWLTRSEPGKGLMPAHSVSRINKSHTEKIESVLDKSLQQFRERRISESELKRAISQLADMAKHWHQKHANYVKRMNHARKVAKQITRDIALEMAGTA